MADESKDMNDFLKEEMEEEALFQSLTQHRVGGADGIVHSLTSDTLDSVYLDPPSIDQDIEGPEEGGVSEPKLDKVDEHLDESAADVATIDEDKATTEPEVKNFTIGAANETSQPSLSKYFGTVDDDPFAQDFFSSLAPVEDDTQGKINNLEQTANETETKETAPHEEEVADEMFNLTLTDPKDEQVVETVEEKSINNHMSFQDPTVADVDFELEVDETEKVETPVALEEKDDFESFTADIADSETMDALGMSPAASSFMNDRHLQNFFRQTSQPESRSPLSTSRQVSHTSVTESIGPVVETIEETEATQQSSPVALTVEPEQPEKTVVENMSSEVTPVHQPIFPPSTTLSPVDSPVHQPFPTTQEVTSGCVTSPEHKLSAFQAFTDSGVGDDPFSTCLQMSDSDRQHDAWIPSEASKTILIGMATHAVGSYVPDIELLVSPVLVITEPQGDPVRDLVYRYMGEQEALKRQVLTAENVPQDTEGMKQLMEAGCYRSAIDLTGRLLAQIGQDQVTETHTVHSPESLQLWYCRFSLMMKLRMYSIVESEIIAFKNLDTPDIYYEFYPQLYPGKRGSIVPFGMRLLHAELPHHLGRSQETLDRLYYILAITQKILKNLNDGLSEDGSAMTISAESRKASQDLWESRQIQTLYCIGNTLVAVRDYDAALSVYDILLEKDPSHRTSLLSGLGRIHLQIGNLPKAMDYFQQVRSAPDMTEGQVTISLLMCRGFEAMCQNNFNEAYQNFKSAVQADPANPSAVNNMAVCCLYLGRLKEALKSLEALVHRNPSKNLHEGILFNLCTLYELESSRALHKKQALLDLVSKHKGDGFPVVCLKMA